MKLTIWSAFAVALLVSGCGESRRNGDPGGEPVSFRIHLERRYVRHMQNQQWTPSGAVAVGSGSNGGPYVSSGLSMSFSATSVYIYGGDKIATADVFVRELKWGDNAFTVPLAPHRQLFLTVKATGGREGYQLVGTVTIPDSPQAAIRLALGDDTQIQVLPLQVELATPRAPTATASTSPVPPTAASTTAIITPAAAAGTTTGIAAASVTAAASPSGASSEAPATGSGSPGPGTAAPPETLSAGSTPVAADPVSTPPETHDTPDTHDTAVSAPGAGVNTIGMPATGATMPSGLAVAPSSTPPQPAPAKTLPDPLANPPPPIPPVPPHPDLIPQQ